MRSKVYKKRIFTIILVIALLTNYVSILTMEETTTAIAKTNETAVPTTNYIATKGYMKFVEDSLATGLTEIDSYYQIIDATQNYKIDGIPAAVESSNNINALIQKEETKTITWTVNVAKNALYEIHFNLKPMDGTILPAKRKIKVNGEYQYDELTTIAFRRFFKDSSKPIVNSLGDEVKPLKSEIKQFGEYSLRDSQGNFSSSLLISLKAGANEIAMEYLSEPVMISQIILQSPTKIKTYAEIKKEYSDKNYKSATKSIKIEAEDIKNIEWTNDASLSISSSNDTRCSPASITSVKMNVFGDYSWRLANQAIKWKFTATESGLYKLNIRTFQGFGYGLKSGRNIKIDDKVPFQELSCYRFDFNREWYSKALTGAKSEEYEIYLEKGPHTITMEVVLGEIHEINNSLNTAFDQLSELYRKIGLIIGVTPDPNYDYELAKAIPELGSSIDSINKYLVSAKNKINFISTTPPAVLNEISVLEQLLIECKKDPFVIAKKYRDIYRGIISIGDILQTISEQPLSIDFLEFIPTTQKVDDYRSTFLQNMVAVLQNFWVSFFKNYDAIDAGNKDVVGSKKTIKVWISRGKEWAEILSNLIDGSFTPEKNINVRLDIIPQNAVGSSNPLLLAINAGNPPDVAMSIPTVTTSTSLAGGATPIEYAIRDSALNLSVFPDFNEVKSRFNERIFVPLTYKGNVYGIPETSNFRVMFYRTDIFAQYGYKLPKTWDELTNDLLPKLNQNNMTMYLPVVYDMFLPQHGGSYYDKSGLFSDLNSAASFTAFNQLCTFYTDYRIPQYMNFYNRFKVGTVPIGIDSYLSYMQIYEAAPEIAGKWAVAPIPGVLQGDGTINNSTAGIAAEADMIIKQTKFPKQSWEFIKWWTDKDTQTSFGTQVESRIGAYARWNTANVEAFASLPWNKEHTEVFKQMWATAVEQPYVLGGYFTARHLGNALNRVVISNQPVREALEESVEAIDKELKRKQEYYGIFRDNLKGEN